MSGGPGAGPSCWLLIPRSIPQIPGSRRLRELELCGKVFSGHLLSPLCVPSPSPCGLRHSKTSSFLLPFSRLPWLVLSERGWVERGGGLAARIAPRFWGHYRRKSAK